MVFWIPCTVTTDVCDTEFRCNFLTESFRLRLKIWISWNSISSLLELMLLVALQVLQQFLLLVVLLELQEHEAGVAAGASALLEQIQEQTGATS